MSDLECYINLRGYLRYLKRAGTEEGGIEEGAPVYIAGDLRSSTDRIMRAVGKAIEDERGRPVNCGNIPSPALAYYAMQHGCASIMVTGSHIPDDRNGIKPNKVNGEVLKSDEEGIKACVWEVREEEYARLSTERSLFDEMDMFKERPPLPRADERAKRFYIERY